MKMTRSLMQRMTNTEAIMHDMTEALRQLDPAFPAEEAKFLKAAAALAAFPSARDYLNAMEVEFSGAILYIGWQGFRLNLDIFRHPVNALLLNGDFETLCQERQLNALPSGIQARATIDAFHTWLKTQPETVQCLTDDISDYYSYLRSTGYKLAHYFGFLLADRLGPQLIPGYTADSVNTGHYTAELGKYLQLDLSRADELWCSQAV